MALPNEIHPFHFAGAGQGYQVSNSLRFRSSNSAYLSRTPGSASNRTTWTWSGWIKRGALGTTSLLFSASEPSSSSQLFISSGDQLTYYSGTATINLITSQVFRDPSAWYHIVAVLDTTQATSSNRVKLYVNGSQVTSFATAVYPSQNAVTGINNNVLHEVSAQVNNGSNNGLYFDGYMAEVNFIDGQALTPSSFAQYDSNNVWQPIKYTGTYGTNGFYLPFNTPVTSSYSGSFNGSNQYLQATLPATLSGAFTIEYFFNRGSSGNQFMFTLGDSANSTGIEIYIGSTGTVLNALWGGSSKITATGSTSVIPVSSWNHVALTRDASNNVRLFLNGVQVGSTVANTNAIDTVLRIGVEYFSSSISGYMNGSISNFRVINGTCLYTSNYNVPAAALTAVSGTSILTLQSATVIDNSGNSLSITNNGTVTTSAATPWTNYIAGQDISGNGNGWTSSGVSVTAGTTYDVMIDSPTSYNDGSTYYNRGSYAVLNPIDSGGTNQLIDGNLTFYTQTGVGNMITKNSTFWASSGKWYFEVTVNNGSATSVTNTGACGLMAYDPAQTSPTRGGGIGYGSNDFMWRYDGYKVTGGTATAYGTAVNANYDVVMCAYDHDTGRIWFGKNGTWFGSGNPATGTNASFDFGYAESRLKPSIQSIHGGGGTMVNVLNFGQRPFAYTPPAGFLALNSYNLTNPSLPLV